MNKKKGAGKVFSIIILFEILLGVFCLLIPIGLVACIIFGEIQSLEDTLYKHASILIAFYGLAITIIFNIPYTEKWWRNQEPLLKTVLIFLSFFIALFLVYLTKKIEWVEKLANPISYVCVVAPLIVDLIQKIRNNRKSHKKSNITNAELSEAISTDTSLSKEKVDAVIKSFTSIVACALANKDSVQLNGFGTFETFEKSSKTGRNHKTGNEVQIPARTVVKFKAGAVLKATVNPPKAEEKAKEAEKDAKSEKSSKKRK